MKSNGWTIVIIAFLLFGVFFIFSYLQKWQPDPVEVLKAEQEIYNVVLAKEKFYHNVPLVEFTCAGEVGMAYETDDKKEILQFGEFVSGDFPEIEKAVWLDYNEKNRQTYHIENYLSPDVDANYVNPVNDNTIDDYVTLSRIGFNNKLTQALVLIGTCSGDLCSDINGEFMLTLGYYYFLEKKNDSWKVADYSLGWIGEAPSP